MTRFVLALACVTLMGCSGVLIEPGHRGLYFDPSYGGLQREIPQPGWYRTPCGIFRSACPRVEDFDVTFKTKKESADTISRDGHAMRVDGSVTFRPILVELRELDLELGAKYYDEVVSPEFRDVLRTVLARYVVEEARRSNARLEGEIASELRARLRGKHIEISAVMLDKLAAPAETGCPDAAPWQAHDRTQR
jgi:regulator of protease activity HflC (stomatin/prohibitin superfamily)